MLTYVLGCAWYRVSYLLHKGGSETWYTNIMEKTDLERFVISCYFILTTLSTVGYGDYSPVSIVEKIIGSVIMFCGVIYFSLLMGKFIDIVLSFKDTNMSENEK